jgi:hypothetical protein
MNVRQIETYRSNSEPTRKPLRSGKKPSPTSKPAGTLVAPEGVREFEEEMILSTRLLIATSLLGSCSLLVGCNTGQGAANTNANAGTVAVAQTTTTTRPGPDNSEITTTTDANGVKSETRVFKDNPRVSKVVVTTRNGTRTTRVYARSGEEKDVNSVENALDATGDAIASAAGFVADKTVEGTKKGVEVGKTAAEKTGGAAKKVGEETAEGAKTVANKTAGGAKKAGKAIKRAVSP